MVSGIVTHLGFFYSRLARVKPAVDVCYVGQGASRKTPVSSTGPGWVSRVDTCLGFLFFGLIGEVGITIAF